MKNPAMYQLATRMFTELMKGMDSVANMRESAGSQIVQTQFMKMEVAKDMKGNVKNWSVKLRSFQVNIARCTAMSAGNHIAKILRQSADFA